MGLLRSLSYSFGKKRMLKNIDIENDNAKRIVRYQPSPIEAFFNAQFFPSKIVVSGGVIEFRARAICGACIAAFNQNIPTVILHAGNKRLEFLLTQEFSGQNYICINQTNPIYDPLIGLKNIEINNLIMGAAGNGCEIKSAGKYYIEGVTDFIKAKGVNPYIDMYTNCPHLQLFDKIDQAESAGQINAQIAQDVKSKIVQGQIERNNIEYFFDTLNHQGMEIFANKKNLHNAESVKRVVQRGGIILIDILSSVNSQLINLIASEITMMLSNGQKLLLVTDSISIGSSESFSKIITKNFQNCGLLFSSDDAYSSFEGNDSLFNSFVGATSKYVVFNHGSAVSAGKWSQIIGDYDKKEVNIGVTTAKTYPKGFTFTPDYTSSENIGMSFKRENRVKPEEIMRMRSNEAYINDAQSQEFAYCEIV